MIGYSLHSQVRGVGVCVKYIYTSDTRAHARDAPSSKVTIYRTSLKTMFPVEG